jgi:hypothetical protein
MGDDGAQEIEIFLGHGVPFMVRAVMFALKCATYGL